MLSRSLAAFLFLALAQLVTPQKGIHLGGGGVRPPAGGGSLGGSLGGALGGALGGGARPPPRQTVAARPPPRETRRPEPPRETRRPEPPRETRRPEPPRVTPHPEPRPGPGVNPGRPGPGVTSWRGDRPPPNNPSWGGRPEDRPGWRPYGNPWDRPGYDGYRPWGDRPRGGGDPWRRTTIIGGIPAYPTWAGPNWQDNWSPPRTVYTTYDPYYYGGAPAPWIGLPALSLPPITINLPNPPAAGCNAYQTTYQSVIDTTQTFTDTITQPPPDALVTVYVDPDTQETSTDWGPVETIYEVIVYTTTATVDVIQSTTSCGIAC